MRFLMALCFFGLIWYTSTIQVFAAQKNNCAPAVPPAIPGPLVQPGTTPGTLFINEVLPFAHEIWECPQPGTTVPPAYPWVELYNTGNQAFDLYSAHTSLDTGPGTHIFYFPLGSAIAAHGFLVIFPFQEFSSGPQSLRLLVSSVAIDQVAIPTLTRDQAYARLPDGGSTWQITTVPTIDASNVLPPITIGKASTPKSSPTAHAQKSSSKKSGTSQGRSTQSSSGAASDKSSASNISSPINRVQPTWSALQLPGSTPTGDNAVRPTIGATSSTPTTASIDLPAKLLLTLLVAALIGALFWYWRRFSGPSP